MPNRYPSSRRTLPATLFAVVLALAVGLGSFLAASAATFTDQASVPDNTFTTDTLDPPTSITALPGTAEGTVDLSWTATVDTYASGYRVFRSATAGGPYSQIDEVTPQSATNYQDSGLDAGTVYYYVLRSFYQNWESVNSDEAAVAAPGLLNLQENDTEMSTATSPAGKIDTNNGQTDYFTATSPVVSASNEIDWALALVLRDKPDVAAPATISIWWQNGGACSGGAVPGQIFATGSVTVPIAVDMQGVAFTVPKVGGSVSRTFVAGDLLCMSIRADGSGGDYDLHYYANTASTSGTPGVSRLAGPFVQDALDPPTNVAASTGATEGTIDLSWTATVDTYADGYRVFRSTTSGGPYSQIAEVTPQSATSYQDAVPSAGTYYYVVQSFWESLESGDSNEASATATAPGALNLQENDTEMSTATSPAGNIDTNDGDTDYYTATSPVTSASNGSDWTLVLVLRDKPDAAAPATINVWWQNGGACSDGSVPGQIFATGSVTVPIAVDKQGVALKVPKVGGSVSHTFVSGDLLCMSIQNDGTQDAQDIHAYANTASTSGTTGVSRLAGPFAQDDTLDPPTDVAASTGATEGTIDLSWTATVDTYADGYRVFRSTTSGGPYSQIDEVTPQSATSYQDTNLTAGTYYYVVRSFWQSLESADSNEATGATIPVLNLQENDTEMSTATSPAGNIDTNNGATDYFTATSPVTSASNDTDWALALVLRDKPNVAAPATVTVWWQNGGSCSGGAVPGQIFATGSVTVPIAVDKQGGAFTVPKVGGTVSRTFVAGDLLCMSISADGSGGDYDLHYYANTASTSGTSGVSRLKGSFTQ